MRALILALLITGPACASGYIEMPPVEADLHSFQACLAALEAQAARDRARDLTPRVADQTITLESDGVTITGPDAARYQSDLWYHNRRSVSGTGGTATSHSYERVILTCDGATLRSSVGQGYTLDTFD